MHQKDVGIPWCIRILLLEKEVLFYLAPDALLFHITKIRRLNWQEKLRLLYLQPVWKQADSSKQRRGISSFGRALAWHARGDRFDSGILHTEGLAIAGLFYYPSGDLSRSP
jgi:hypothetical protein